MKLNVLGMNGPYPAPGNATSGYLLSAGQTLLQLDLGSGTLAVLTRLMPPEDLTALVLTHWHFDHCCDVLPLLYRLNGCEKAPLHVYAPVDDDSPIRQALMRDHAVVVHDIAPGDELVIGDVTLRVYPARHPVPAVMLRLSAEGKTLCYTGDTNVQDGLTDYAQDADLLLADGLFTKALWAENKPHLSAAHVAEIARDANVKRVVVTHLNPAIDPETLLKEAREVRQDAILAHCGDVYTI